MAQSRHAWIILAIAAGNIGLAAQTPARAAPANIGVVDISGPSPFAPDGCGVDISQLGSEYEPDLAVNPKDQRNIIAIWSQDKQISNVVATSHDGGEHWTQVLVPGLSKCTGGTADNALDARVSFGSDGTAYLSSQVVDSKHARLFWTLLVNRSTDGGLSWSDPVTIDQAGPWPALALDFPVLVADPRRPGTAYVVWSRFHDLFTAPAAPQFFARTTDGGVTWTPPAMIPITPLPNQTAFSSQIRVLSDGTLLNVFIQIPVDLAPIGPTSVWAMRSQDQGDSWSAPIFVADVPENVVTDPDNGQVLGRGNSFVTPSVAVGANKEAYVVWHLIESTVSSRILFAKSLDGGVTWSAPAALAVAETQAFLPTVAVSPSGAVGVTYFDFRGDVSGDQQLTTDLWFRHSRDGGATWSETHVAGPFDIRPAPYPGAFPLGDYFGLQPIGRDGFGAVFVQTISPQTQGVTDVFFAQVQVPPARQAGDSSGCTMSPAHTNSGRLFAWLVVPVLMLQRARRRWGQGISRRLRDCYRPEAQHGHLPARGRDRDQEAAMKGSDALGRARPAIGAFSSELCAWPLAAALACAALFGTGAHSAQAGINVWTSHGPTGESVSAVAIDPNTTGTLYAATGFGGVFKSTDAGSTWDAVSTGLTKTYARALAIDPTTPSTLYAATGTGISKSYGGPPGSVFKSTDVGSSWNDTVLPRNDTVPVTVGDARIGIGFIPGFAVVGIAVDPTNSSTLYAVTNLGGVLKSTDGGGSWRAANTGLGRTDDGAPTYTSVNALVITPTTPSTLYAATGSGGVFKSTDDASSWAATGLTDTSIGVLAIDPVTPSTLYAASNTDVLKSTDGAGSWNTITAGLSSTSISALVIDPNTPSTLYAGTDGAGVFKSTDGASSWHIVNTGLTNTDVDALAIDPFMPSTLYAGTIGGGVFSIQQITVSPCIGDCDDITAVTIANLLTMVNIALGTVAISECAAGDRNQDNAISVDEILAAVNNALSACPVPPTPTRTATHTITLTPTSTPSSTPAPAVAARAAGR